MGNISVIKAFNSTMKQILGVDKMTVDLRQSKPMKPKPEHTFRWTSCVPCKHSANDGQSKQLCIDCFYSGTHANFEQAEPDSDKTSPTVSLAKHIAEEAKNPVSEKELADVMDRLERSNASRVSRSQLHDSIKKSCEAIPKLFDYKNADYGQQSDAFANFRKTAERIVRPFMQRHGITIEIDESMFLVMQVLQDKHLVALSQTGLSGNEVAERLGDVANYALIQKALYEAVDRGNNDDE